MTHAIHDFTGKLRQPSLLPTVQAYVNWRRALRDARAKGEPDPAPRAGRSAVVVTRRRQMAQVRARILQKRPRDRDGLGLVVGDRFDPLVVQMKDLRLGKRQQDRRVGGDDELAPAFDQLMHSPKKRQLSLW